MALAARLQPEVTVAPTQAAASAAATTAPASTAPTAASAPPAPSSPALTPTGVTGSLRLYLRRTSDGSGYQLVSAPPPGTGTQPPVVESTVPSDPAGVAGWWHTLPAAEQTVLETDSPDVLRGLNGVPVLERDQLNRQALAAAEARLTSELADLATHPPKFDAVTAPDSGFGILGPGLTKWENTFQLAQAQLTGMRDLDAALADPQMHLLYFDMQGRGHLAVSYGDPDTAGNVAVIVPGTGTDLTTVGTELGHVRQLAQDAANTAANGTSANGTGGTPPPAPSGDGGTPPGGASVPAAIGGEQRRSDAAGTARTTTAVVEWIGYDTPFSIADATSPNYAQNALPAFTAFMAGLSATHQGAPAHTTLIGHSYGSLLVGMAMSGRKVTADDVILIGSPGVGVDHAAALGIDPSHVWAATGGGDWIKTWALPFRTPTQIMNEATLTFGPDPHSPVFGARLFDAGQADHTQYFDPAYPALANMAAITVGDDAKVTPPSG